MTKKMFLKLVFGWPIGLKANENRIYFPIELIQLISFSALFGHVIKPKQSELHLVLSYLCVCGIFEFLCLSSEPNNHKITFNI